MHAFIICICTKFVCIWMVQLPFVLRMIPSKLHSLFVWTCKIATIFENRQLYFNLLFLLVIHQSGVKKRSVTHTSPSWAISRPLLNEGHSAYVYSTTWVYSLSKETSLLSTFSWSLHQSFCPSVVYSLGLPISIFLLYAPYYARHASSIPYFVSLDPRYR